MVAIILLSGFLVFQGRNLWLEWTMFQSQLSAARARAVVGYPDIAPRVTFARRPANWYHENGHETLLWSRWDERSGHIWFRLAPGDIDKALLTRPTMEVISRPIDNPVIETDGGAIWKRIPLDAPVVGHTMGGVRCVYPVPVLSKVQIINDMVENRPYLITLNLLAPANEAISIYEAELNGRRVTMDVSGYFSDLRPLLFDRGTESLWIEDGAVLKSLAGKYKGQQLSRLARPAPVSWVSWLAKNPRSRLVVGADRTRAIPSE